MYPRAFGDCCLDMSKCIPYYLAVFAYVRMHLLLLHASSHVGLNLPEPNLWLLRQRRPSQYASGSPPLAAGLLNDDLGASNVWLSAPKHLPRQAPASSCRCQSVIFFKENEVPDHTYHLLKPGEKEISYIPLEQLTAAHISVSDSLQISPQIRIADDKCTNSPSA